MKPPSSSISGINMSSNENDAMERNDVLVEANILIQYTSKTELRIQRYHRSNYAQKLGFGEEKSTEMIFFPDLDLARFPRFAAVTVAAGLGEEEAGRGELAGVEERPGRRPAGSGRSGGPRRWAAAAAGVEDEAGDGRSWRGGAVAPERRRGGSGHRARGRGRRRRALAAETSARRRPAVAESGAGRGPPGPAAR